MRRGEALAARDLLPAEHFVDAGYVDAPLLVTSKAQHQIEMVGPVRPDVSWQGKAGEGYDLSGFALDWEAQAVTCPQGQSRHLPARTEPSLARKDRSVRPGCRASTRRATRPLQRDHCNATIATRPFTSVFRAWLAPVAPHERS